MTISLHRSSLVWFVLAKQLFLKGGKLAKMMGSQGRWAQPLKKYVVTFSFMFINIGCIQQVTASYSLEGGFACYIAK